MKVLKPSDVTSRGLRGVRTILRTMARFARFVSRKISKVFSGRKRSRRAAPIGRMRSVSMMSVSALFVFSVLASVLLPVMQASAERTLTWTSNADFAQNKISECEKTEVQGVTITGAKYGDESCGESEEDASVTLVGNEPLYLSDVKDVAAGGGFVLALKNDGTVWAWGRNQYGELGDNTTKTRRLPIQVKDATGEGYLDGITAIAAASRYSLALKNDGTVWAWGDNNSGQLGDGTTTRRYLPVQARDSDGYLEGVKNITVGSAYPSSTSGEQNEFSIAIKNDRTVWTWGKNNRGQLGNNTTTTSPLAVQVVGALGTGFLTDIIDISAGSNHVLAVKSDGTVWAWGINNGGQLGNNTTTASYAPIQVLDSSGIGFLTGVKKVAAGSYADPGAGHSLALKNDGTVWAWGDNYHGQLGDSTKLDRRLPTQVKDVSGANYLENIESITAGPGNSLAIHNDGTVWAWGTNRAGQLGNGNTISSSLPRQVRGFAGEEYLSGVKSVSLSSFIYDYVGYVVALRSDGAILAWGSNQYGQLGDGTFDSSLEPLRVISGSGDGILSGIEQVAAGAEHTLALKEDGTVWAWGSGESGALGDQSIVDATFPVQVKDSQGTGYLSDIVAIAAGNLFSLALSNNGTVWAWGNNRDGQLGNNTTSSANTLPVQVKSPSAVGVLENVVSISAGGRNNTNPTGSSLALAADGTVWAWGGNNYGQLGNDTQSSSSLPVQVKNMTGDGYLSGITSISMGVGHALALGEDGTVWAWGDNTNRQIGDGTSTRRSLPVRVLNESGVGNLTGIKAISAGGFHSIAINDNGDVFAWGNNSYGQLCDNSSTIRGFPVQMRDSVGSGYLTHASMSAGGLYSSTVLKEDGTVWSCGANYSGQLGDGSSSSLSRLPVPVVSEDGQGVLTDVIAVTSSNSISNATNTFSHVFALKSDKAVLAWGNNNYGQIGNPNAATVQRNPIAVAGTGGYNTEGTIAKITIDAGATRRTQWNNLNWQTEALPSQTSVAFEIRTSQNGTDWSDWSTPFTQDTKDSTSHSADLSALPMSRFAELRMTLKTEYTLATPQVNDFSLSFLEDTVTPPQNAATIQASRGQGGAAVTDGNWSNVPPYLSWDAAEDQANGSGIWGYCMYVGHDETADVIQTKGNLGSSPIDSNGACQYLIASTSLDLSQPGVLGTALASSSDPYYVRIKAIDNVGNLYDGDAETFSFKYDNVAPHNPSFISAPAGFVSNKNILLTWPSTGEEGPSDDVSGVVGLQYRIGADGQWYGDGHTGAGDITDLLANDGSYRLNETFDYPNITEGNNVIYFRTYDAAGNTSTTYSTAAVKINTSAPSSPQSVNATPSTNTANSFAFSWQKPATFVGTEDGLSYCYTINVLPAANTCVFTDETSLSADAYATQPGQNTLYVVAKDESGNINFDTYASTTFTANTAAPGVPSSMEMADISTKATSTWKLALSWEPPTDTGAGVAKYQIFRSTDGTNFTQIATTAGKSYVDADLAQLTYSYKVKACDSANNCGAFSATISALPTGRYTTPPELVSNPSVETSTRRASFYWVTDRESDSRVQFGTKSGVYQPGEITVSDETKTHSVDLTNLDAGTTYYYRVKWMDEDGNVGVSNEFTFKTLPAPVVKSVEVTKANLSSAIIRIVTRDATRVSLYYGKSENFGGVKSINTSLSESTYDIELTGLDDGSPYFFKIITTDSDGNTYDSNRIDTFSTPPRPRISNLQFQPVDGEPTSTQKVTWTTNIPTSSLVTYGQTGTSGTDSYKSTMTTRHEITISNLTDDSEYFLLAQGRDRDGNLAVSDRQIFRTALDTRPPKISDVRVETSVSGSGQSAQGQIIVYWKTDEPATSQVSYALGSNATEFTNATAQDARLTTDHIVIISNLSFSTIYSLRPVSEDNAGNKVDAAVQSAIIGRPTESILDIISGALSRLFGL